MRQELFASRSHALMLVSLPLVVVGLGVASTLELGLRATGLAAADPAEELLRALSLAAIGLGGLLVAALAPSLVRRTPALVFDDEGLDDRGAFGAGRVRWEDVAAVRVVRLTRAYVGLDLVDVEAFLAGAPRLRRLAVRTSLAMGYPPITIAGRALGLDAHDLARTLSAARLAALAQGDAPPGAAADDRRG